MEEISVQNNPIKVLSSFAFAGIRNVSSLMLGMAVRVVKFSSRGYKFRKSFAEESTYPKEIIEFWVLDQWWAVKNFSNKVI